MGLSRPIPKPVSETNSNQLPKSPSKASLAYEKCRRFLNNLKTPSEMRNSRMSELNKPLYDDCEVPDIENDKENIPEPTTLAKDPEMFKGRVNFGPLGFLSLGHAEEQNHDEHCVEDENDTVPTEGLNKDLENEPEKTVENPNEVMTQDSLRQENEPEINSENILNNQESEINVDQEGNPCGGEDILSSDKSTANNMNDGKKRKLKATTEKAKKKKITTKTVKDSRAKRAKEVKPGKSDRASKKGFKDQFLTLKFNVSQMQPLAGTSQDFLVLVKDNVHSPDARPAALHAGKYVTFGKGEIFDQFLSNQGLRSNPHDFFFCANEVDFVEDRAIPFVNAKRNASVATAKQATQQTETEEILSSSESDDSSEKSDSEIEQDLSDIRPAKRVSWGAPTRESSESDISSGGVNVYGRAVEKTVSKEKKKKKSEKKNRSKDAAKKSSVDILEKENVGGSSEVIVGKKKKVSKPKKGGGGGGSGARGKTSKRGLGKSSGSGTRKS